MRRGTVAVIVGTFMLILAVPSSLSVDFLSNQDFVWYAMMVVLRHNIVEAVIIGPPPFIF